MPGDPFSSDNHTTIGYARYQQQDQSGKPSSDLASIILFISIILILLISFVFYFWFTEWHKVPPQQRHEEQLEHQKEIDQLVDNLKQQTKTVFRIPVVQLAIVLWSHRSSSNSTNLSREHHKVLTHRIYHLFSLTCLLGVIIGLVTLIGANNTLTPRDSGVLQAALFVFVLCTNLYLITRQRCYYKERKELFGSDDAHLSAVYKTRFKDWNAKLWSNWIQIAILVIEFFQLLAFPLRDLITVNSFANQTETQSTHLVSIIMNAGGLMPDMRTPTWYTYSLWTAFVAAYLSLIVAIAVHLVNKWRPYKVPNRWVHWCIPVASLLYIPVMTTFVSSAACQSLNVSSNDFAHTLRCYSPQISQQLYLWMSLAGYVVAYFLLTIFLTSYERKPSHNEIAFKSISVAFIKNMGLLLAIVFLLVESTSNKNRMRAILSITILLTMICYNIKTRPCYVDKINFFRTASFSCILWTSVLVAILSDTNAAQSLGPMAVLCIIVGGWGLIIVLYLLLYFIYYKQPIEYYCSDDKDDQSACTTELKCADTHKLATLSELSEDEVGRASPPDHQNQPTTSNDQGWWSWASRKMGRSLRH